jgi:dephospho-CoA kinase
MKFVGLTGGIGSGKSAVGELLSSRGAAVIDVDLLSRRVQEPGRPAYVAMVDRWGSRILLDDSSLNRRAVAELVFAEPDEMTALHRMTGTAIEAEIYREAEAFEPMDRVVVLETALFTGGSRLYGIEGVVVVDTPPEVAVERLVRQRGMAEDDARARLASQPRREDRLLGALDVIDNSGPVDRLEPQVGRAWERIWKLPDGHVVRRGAAPS